MMKRCSRLFVLTLFILSTIAIQAQSIKSEKKTIQKKPEATENPFANMSGQKGNPRRHQLPPLQFKKTGKMLKAVGITYSVYPVTDMPALMKKPAIIKLISIAKTHKITGTDEEILKRVIANSDLFEQIKVQLNKEVKSKAQIDEISAIVRPYQSFAVGIGSFHHFVTNDYIRSDFVKVVDPENRNRPGAPLYPVTIVDLKAKKSYAIANYSNLIAATIVKDVNNLNSIFGEAYTYTQLLPQTNLKITRLGKREIGAYQTQGISVEIPVKPFKDKDGKADGRILSLHSKFNEKKGEEEAGYFDPHYKLYLEMYYTHDLDKLLPAEITKSNGLSDLGGFMVGFTLKDEHNNQISSMVSKVDPHTELDSGMLTIPAGYAMTTEEQFLAAIKELLSRKR